MSLNHVRERRVIRTTCSEGRPLRFDTTGGRLHVLSNGLWSMKGDAGDGDSEEGDENNVRDEDD